MGTKKNQAVTIEHFPVSRYEFQAAHDENEAGRFSGIASVFGSMVDTFPHRTRFQKGAFLKTINDRASRIKILSQHDQGTIWIGLPIKLQEAEEGLLIEASLNNTERGRDAAAALKHAASLGKLDAAELSIGFDALVWELAEEDDGETVRVVTEARLWEISLVNFGADKQTKVLEAAKRDMDRQFKADDPLDFTLLQLIELAAPPAPSEGHAGRVLSSKNKTHIRDAIKALTALMEAAEPPEDDDPPALTENDSELQFLELAEAEAMFSHTLANN